MTVHKQSADKSPARGRRYRIAAPARFSWRSRDGVLHRGEGTTRDIGARGVFICARQVPAAGTVVDVDIIFSSAPDKMVPASLSGTGTVLRVDKKDRQPSGFAARIRFAIASAETYKLLLTRDKDHTVLDKDQDSASHGRSSADFLGRTLHSSVPITFARRR